MKKLYLAAPLGTPVERRLNVELAAMLSRKFTVYLPQRDSGLLEELRKTKSLYVAAVEVYQANTAAVATCDIMVARKPHLDEGVAFEIGFATALGKDVILLHEGPDHEMLWMGSKATFDRIELNRWFDLL